VIECVWTLFKLYLNRTDWTTFFAGTKEIPERESNTRPPWTSKFNLTSSTPTTPNCHLNRIQFNQWRTDNTVSLNLRSKSSNSVYSVVWGRERLLAIFNSIIKFPGNSLTFPRCAQRLNIRYCQANGKIPDLFQRSFSFCLSLVQIIVRNVNLIRSIEDFQWLSLRQLVYLHFLRSDSRT